MVPSRRGGSEKSHQRDMILFPGLLFAASLSFKYKTIISSRVNLHIIAFSPYYGTRLNRPVTEHLSTQGRLDPRGALRCFWCPNNT
jgi:hypothetical protein